MKIVSAIALLILSFFAITPTADARSWYEVSDRKTLGISGMAALNASGTEFLVVHDNKNAGEPRLGKVTLIDGSINYETLPWPEGDLPVDLEAITAVPGRDREFVALSSSGRGSHIAVNGAIVGLGTFSLPPVRPHANIEGFTLRANAY